MERYEINWTEKAKQQNLENVNFLFEKWGVSSVLKYENELIEKLEQIAKMPFSAPVLKSNYRKILIVKQISLIYKIDANNNQITILMVWNNYKNPVSLLVR